MLPDRNYASARAPEGRRLVKTSSDVAGGAPDALRAQLRCCRSSRGAAAGEASADVAGEPADGRRAHLLSSAKRVSTLDEVSMLNHVFMLDEVVMLDEVIGRILPTNQRVCPHPWSEPRGSAGIPWLQRMSAAGARWAAVSSSVSL